MGYTHSGRVRLADQVLGTSALTTLAPAPRAFAVTLSFFSLEAAAHTLLGHTVPHDGVRTAVHAALVAVLLVGSAVVVGYQLTAPARPPSARRARLAVHLRNGLYANAAFDRLVSSLSTTPSTPGQAR